MKRALVLSLICALGFAFTGMAASLTGYWDTEVTIDPQAAWPGALTLTSDIQVVYTVGDWAFTSFTSLSELGWVDQTFDAAGVLGAFSLSSALDLDPAGAFDSWVTTGAVSIAGVTFGMEFEIDGTDAYLTLSGSGVAGDVTVGAVVTFGDDVTVGCDLPWTGVTIDVGFPFCCADIALVLDFDCTGFVEACFSVGGIAIPNIPWLTLDAEVCFTLEEKIVTLTPSFEFGTIACFTIDLDFASAGGVMAPLTVGDIVISGIGLTCDIGAVTFSGYTDFTAMNPEYFEWYTIETNDDVCCGVFNFDLTFYFLDGGVALFDVALIEANMEMSISETFTFKMGLDVNVETGLFTKWMLGFLVTW
jgi:hypothetical protein